MLGGHGADDDDVAEREFGEGVGEGAGGGEDGDAGGFAEQEFVIISAGDEGDIMEDGVDEIADAFGVDGLDLEDGGGGEAGEFGGDVVGDIAEGVGGLEVGFDADEFGADVIEAEGFGDEDGGSGSAGELAFVFGFDVVFDGEGDGGMDIDGGALADVIGGEGLGPELHGGGDDEEDAGDEGDVPMVTPGIGGEAFGFGDILADGLAAGGWFFGTTYRTAPCRHDASERKFSRG